MTPARSPDPAAEAVSALREALINTVQRRLPIDDDAASDLVHHLLIDPLAPLLADIAALRTRVEEAEKHLLQAVTSSWPADVIDHKATTAERDRLAEENARLRAALKPFAFGDPTLERILFDGMPDEAPGTFTIKMGDIRAARRALDTATGETTNAV